MNTPLDLMRAVRDWPAPTAHKAVLWCLVLRSDASGQAWPSIPTIARDAGTSRATVIRTLAQVMSDPTCPIEVTSTRRCQAGTKDAASNLYRLRLRPEAERDQSPKVDHPVSPDVTPSHRDTGSQGDTRSQPETGLHGDTTPVSQCNQTPSHSETLSAHRTAQVTAQGSIPGIADATAGVQPTDADRPRRRNRKAATADKPQHPDHGTVVACYFAEFERARGNKPPFDSHDGKTVKALLGKLGGDAERACRCIRNAFADPFWKAQVTIRKIAADPARFDGTCEVRPVRATTRAVQPARPGHQWQPTTDFDDLDAAELAAVER